MKKSTRRIGRSIVMSFLAIWLAVGPTALYAGDLWDSRNAHVVQQTTASQGCEMVSTAQLRDELNAISQEIFAAENSPIDIEAIVAAQWIAADLDSVLDSEVDQAIDQVRRDESVWDEFLSGWSPAKAEELTRNVANIAFGSEEFKSAIDELSVGTATAISAEIVALSAESASQATLCLQQYVGGRYSETIVSAFTEKIQAEAELADFALDAGLNSGILTVIGQHELALGGVGVIVASQVAKKVVQKIGQTTSKRVAGRIVGRVLGKAGSTIIPAAGWAIGAGLIVYDLYESREGALPEISSSLSSGAVKSAMRDEVAVAVQDELRIEAPQIARDVSNDLYAIWLDFQRQYRQVLDLADTNVQFRAIVAAEPDTAKLSSLVDTMISVAGSDGVLSAAADGTLARLLSLPESAQAILRADGSTTTVLSWADLAGSRIDDVVRLEIYKHKQPQDLDHNLLASLLALDDKRIIAKLILLDNRAIAELLETSGENLRNLTANLAAEDLQLFAQTTANMEQEKANQLLLHMIQNPGMVEALRDEGVGALLANTPDMAETLAFLAGPVGAWALLDNWVRMASGRISVRLFALKYGVALTATLTILPLLLLMALVFSILSWMFAPFAAVYRAIAALFRSPASSRRRLPDNRQERV